MINPISKNTTREIPHGIPLFSHQQPLEVCSIQSLNPVSWVASCFSALFRLIKRLFCCGYSHNSSAQGENMPEIDPRSLSRRDPFCKQVFQFDSQGNFSFRFKEAFEKTTDIFRILGTTNYWFWIVSAFSLDAKEKEVEKLDSHPLILLYYIFCNKTHTSHIAHFKNQAYSGKWILCLKTGRNPWEEFLKRQTHNFEKYNDILEKLPGFCKALGLEEKPLRELANAKKWRELIIAVFEQRKKHFGF